VADEDRKLEQLAQLMERGELARVRKLLVTLASAVDWKEDGAWDDPEQLLDAAAPLVFEARRLLEAAGVNWKA
jgi:hypothetical protein